MTQQNLFPIGDYLNLIQNRYKAYRYYHSQISHKTTNYFYKRTTFKTQEHVGIESYI
jgi:hypothetical protein